MEISPRMVQAARATRKCGLDTVQLRVQPHLQKMVSRETMHMGASAEAAGEWQMDAAQKKVSGSKQKPNRKTLQISGS